MAAMIKKADLHTHSTASDGQHTPTEVVEKAAALGIEVLALTDHDTIDGWEEAVQAGSRLEIQVVRGVELSAKGYTTFHILGYGFPADAPVLAELCNRMKSRREERAFRLLAYLNEKKIPLFMEDVEEFAGGNIIGRVHFARAMVKQGYVSNTREAFDRYLDTEEYHEKIEGYKPSAQECIAAIRDSGGYAALAHPYQVGLENDGLDALVGRLTSDGLCAIECYYPKHTPEQTAFYRHLADKYHLHSTGGSDFHGERIKPGIYPTAWPLELNWLLKDDVKHT